MRCTTHFHACDCREERFKELEQELADYKLAASVEAKEADRLRQELADTKKKLEDWSNAYHEEAQDHAATAVNMQKIITELESALAESHAFKKESEDKLREALEVLGYFAFHWGGIPMGKRANELMQKHTTKMEG